MSKIITILAITLSFSALAAGQVSNTGPTPAEISQELRMLERKWVDALVRGDAKTLSEVLDDSYTDTDEHADVMDKNSLLAALKSGDLVVSSLSLSGMKVHIFVYGAVVTGRATQTAQYKGQPLAPSIVFTDMFAMINGKWKVVASHRSAPPQPAK